MKQRVSRALALVLVLSLAAILPGCSPAKTPNTPSGTDIPKDGGTLVIATPMDIVSFDPVSTNDGQSQRVMDQVFEKLVATDEEMNIIPAIAESWQPSTDGLQWAFSLHKGIKFTDGKEVTSEDVAFSFQRILDAVGSQKRAKIDMIERIETPDPYTVVFHLSMPYAPFLGAAGQHILPKHVVEEMGLEKFGQKPIGSGPFVVEEWVMDDHVTLVRNEGYWRGKPHLEKVIFRSIPDGTVAAMSAIAGEVDVVTQLDGTMIDTVKDAGVEVKIKEGMTYWWIGFRQTEPPYTDVRFRQMVYYATDVDKIVETVLPSGTGTRAYSPVPIGLWPRDDEYMQSVAAKYKQDKAKAKQLFDELIADGVMTRTTPVVFRVDQNPIKQKIAEVFVTELKEIGVNAQLKVSEWSAYLDAIIKTEEPCMHILGSYASIQDPDAVFNWLFSSTSNNGGNILRLQPSEIDDILVQARSISDRAQREEIYRRVNKWAMEENIFHIPVYFQNVVMAVNTRVHDLEVASNSSALYLMTSFSNVWVDAE